MTSPIKPRFTEEMLLYQGWNQGKAQECLTDGWAVSLPALRMESRQSGYIDLVEELESLPALRMESRQSGGGLTSDVDISLPALRMESRQSHNL